MNATIHRLPTGHARACYSLMRKRGKSVLEALLAASIVDACPKDEMLCERCDEPIARSSGARVRGRAIWCAECALQPTGHEEKQS